MPFNKLYRLIHDDNVVIKTTSANDKGFLTRTNKTQNKYFLYNLEIKNKMFVTLKDQAYQLESHHLSIYEMQDNQNPFLSEYHYTAYFTDRDGLHYELHVYFDHNDKLTIEPIFSLEKDEVVGPKQKNNECSRQLMDFAINETFVVIKQLRQLQKEKIENLENQYIRLQADLSALSVDLMQNQDKYLQIASEIIPVLKALLHYKGDDKYYRSLIKFYQNINNEMAAILNEKCVDEFTESDCSEEDGCDDLPFTVNRTVDKVVVKKTLVSLVESAINARDVYSAVEKEKLKITHTELLTRFINFHQLTHEALLLSDDENHMISVVDLQKVQGMIYECNISGGKLLESFLLHKEYKLSESLVSYVNRVQDRMLMLALAVDNSQLLDFLLKHGDIAINTCTVADNLTPLLFCFTKSKPRCFSILVKHGASLMVDAHDGLPVAHHILSVANHALMSGISCELSNQELIKLYQSVSNFLDNYLKTKQLNKEKRNKLNAPLDYYRMQIIILDGLKASFSEHKLQQLKVETTNLTSKIIDANPDNVAKINLLRTDKELQAKFIQYSKALKLYMAKLSWRDKNQAFATRLEFSNFNEFVDYAEIDLESCKVNTLEYLDRCMKILTLREELINVVIIMKKTMVNKSTVKIHNKSVVRYNEIKNELNALDESCRFPSGKNDANTKVTECLRQMEENLSFFAESFKQINERVLSLQAAIKCDDPALEGANLQNLDFESVANAEAPLLHNPLPTFANSLSVTGFFGERNNTTDKDTEYADSAGVMKNASSSK